VVQVGVTDEGVRDGGLLGDRERSADGSGVDQNTIVDQKGRRPLALTITAKGSKDLQPHSNSPASRGSTLAILVTLV
jgi:hypothetical protein